MDQAVLQRYQSQFNYSEAFARNIGLLTEQEQERIRNSRIAIPGMGGVGGVNLISLVRQGFERFNISDFDTFSMVNFNRQYGADMSTIDKEKAEVMKELALSINPNCDIRVFPHGIDGEWDLLYMHRKQFPGIEKFLKGVDLVIDSIDFYCVFARRALYNTSLKNNVPVISAGPIGNGTAYLIFMPEGPNFDEYFGINEGVPFERALLRFAMGTAPAVLQRNYIYNPRVLFETLCMRQPPSSSGAVSLCAGVNTDNALSVLLDWDNIYPVPYYHQFDPRVSNPKKRYAFGYRHITGLRGWARRKIERTFEDRILKTVFVDELYKIHSDPELYQKYFGHLSKDSK